MSWSIGLSLGESFAEFSATDGKKTIHSRWYRPRVSLAAKLQELADNHPQIEWKKVLVTTQLTQQILERRTGGRIALLVTAGFENWPILRQPIRPDHFTLETYRATPLVSQDLIFGISERTNASGDIVIPVNQNELEFLSAKLKLSHIENVAVGFLHSVKNPKNEAQVAEYLKSQDINVICSHEVKEADNEVARWWRAILNCYLAKDFNELEEKLEESLPGQPEFEFWSSEQRHFRDDSSQTFPSMFGRTVALKEYTQSWLSTNKPKWKNEYLIAHFGLEHFKLVEPSQPTNIYHEDLGPIAAKHPEVQSFVIQPTQTIDKSLWGTASFTGHHSGYEPGPMLFGKSLLPTFVDLLFLTGQLPEIEGLQDNIENKSRSKMNEALQAMIKNADDIRSTSEVATDLIDMALTKIALDLVFRTNEKKILCTGPFAEVMTQLLKDRLPNHELACIERADYTESLATASSESEVA